MLPGIFLAILTLTVGVLVAVDFSRTSDEGLHGHADGSPHDLRPRMVGDTGSGRTEASCENLSPCTMPTRPGVLRTSARPPLATSIPALARRYIRDRAVS